MAREDVLPKCSWHLALGVVPGRLPWESYDKLVWCFAGYHGILMWKIVMELEWVCMGGYPCK